MPGSFSVVVKLVGLDAFVMVPRASTAVTVARYSVCLVSPWIRQLEFPTAIEVWTMLVVVTPGV